MNNRPVDYFTTMTGPQLVAAYNEMVAQWQGLGGDNRFGTTKRFANAAAGVRRCEALEAALVERGAKVEALEAAVEAPFEVDMPQDEAGAPGGPAGEEAVAQPGADEEVAAEGPAGTEESEMAKKAKKAAAKKAPKKTAARGDGVETLVQQMERHNVLAARAIKKGLPARILGKNGTTFASRAHGEKAIAKLEAALAG